MLKVSPATPAAGRKTHGRTTPRTRRLQPTALPTRRLRIAGLSPTSWWKPVNTPPWRSIRWLNLRRTTTRNSTRFAAATALLDRGYGRPAQSLDLHLSADAITKRLSDMTDAELAALEARMIAAAPIVLEAAAEVSDDAGDVEDSPPDALA